MVWDEILEVVGVVECGFERDLSEFRKVNGCFGIFIRFGWMIGSFITFSMSS